jgi:hypothetical protein
MVLWLCDDNQSGHKPQAQAPTVKRKPQPVAPAHDAIAEECARG